jgi:site-specific DNA recombinase
VDGRRDAAGLRPARPSSGVNKAEAETVRFIFRLYLELKTVRRVREELGRRSIVSKQWVSRGNVRHGGFPFGRGALYHVLANPIYLGEIRHRSVTYPGHHEAIIERVIWERVQEMLSKKAAHPRGRTVRKSAGLLMGKLFDDSGEPLYSSWAKKRQRRYRSYVSKRLVRGTANPDDSGWRLPAEGTEEAVVAGMRQILSDRGALASTLKAFGFAAAELKQAVEAIYSKVGSSQQVETTEDMSPLIERVELNREDMKITLNLRALLPADRFPVGGTDLRMTRTVPLQMRRRGIETRIVIPGEEVAVRRKDPALLRALARGYQWFAELAEGRAVSTRQIAAREGVSDSYVRHLDALPSGQTKWSATPPVWFSVATSRKFDERLIFSLRAKHSRPLHLDTSTTRKRRLRRRDPRKRLGRRSKL